MRGSVYYQTALLAKAVLAIGSKKHMRIDPIFPQYEKLASFKTVETYRRVWNNLGLFVKEEYGIKDFALIEPVHIEAYMLDKIANLVSKQYLEKISAAIGKLEKALENWHMDVLCHSKKYDFSIRQKILDRARDAKDVYDGYHDRAYADPERIIDAMEQTHHRVAAKVQLFGGARFEGVGLIKAHQLKGKAMDPVTDREVYVIETKEKGGKAGEVFVAQSEYRVIEQSIKESGRFKIDRQAYLKAIRVACQRCGVPCEGCHGLRWNFAQRRMHEYQAYGYSYSQALQAVSKETKHNRLAITSHYLG